MMCYIIDVLQMSLFRKLVVIMVSLNKPRKIVLTNSIVFVVQKMLKLQFLENT